MLDRTLIISVFVVASCGLAYELIAGALASYLLGDSILQFSTIIGCYLFAMGIGSHLAQYVPEKRVLDRFIEIELLVESEDSINEAENKILEISKSFGMEPKGPFVKREAYFTKVKPELYETLFGKTK